MFLFFFPFSSCGADKIESVFVFPLFKTYRELFPIAAVTPPDIYFSSLLLCFFLLSFFFSISPLSPAMS